MPPPLTSDTRWRINSPVSASFFGSELVASIDPRPAEHRKRAGKKAEVPPFFSGRFLDELTATSINNFFRQRNDSLSNKRHFRELFHGLFEVALKEGLFKPSNPYSATPCRITGARGEPTREEHVGVRT
jgi:hypothetical protein